MSKVLITGVAGFIGSNLADRLIAEGYHVIGLDNLNYGVREQIPKEVEFYQVDIRSREMYPLFKGVDVIFHLAAKNCINDCQLDPIETADINVTGTVNVFEAARRTDVRKIIYAESSAIYEGSTAFPTPEREVQPQSMYAISKLCGMEFAKAYRRFHDLNTTALRYFSVYGARQDYRRTIAPVMSAFIICLLRGERPVIYGTGLKRRDFIHIDDVNRFHLLAMNDNRTNGKVYNLGSGVNYSIREIFEMVKELLDMDGLYRANVEPEYKKDLPGEAEETLADISEAKGLGWKPRVDIHDGLRNMIGWIRENVIKC